MHIMEAYPFPSSCPPGELAVCVAVGEPAVWATDVPWVAEVSCPLSPRNGGAEEVELPGTEVVVAPVGGLLPFVEVGDEEDAAVVDCGGGAGLSARPIRLWSASKTV